MLGTDGDYLGEYLDTRRGNAANLLFFLPYMYKGDVLINRIGTYSWNYKGDMEINNGHGSNIWSTSLLNNINLNTNYLNNIGIEWSNKIENTIWKVGGISEYETNSKNTYVNEIINPSTENLIDGKTIYGTKVGLMYISDYGYAYEKNHWTENVINESTSSLYNNWMQIGASEWTVSRISNRTNFVICLTNGTAVYSGYAGNGEYITFSESPLGVRPVFNLTSNINYVSGDGTKTNPIIIN